MDQAPLLEVAGVRIRHADEVYIGGRWEAGLGGTRTILSPSTNKPIGEVALPSAEQAELAVHRASEEGQPAWSALSVAERAQIVRRMCDLIEERFDEIGLLWAAEAGMGLRHSRMLHRYGATVAWGSAIDVAEEALREEIRYGSPGDVIVRHEPVGVVVGILPYNGPIVTVGTKIVPALLAGCAVVIKAASDSQLVMRVFAECADRAGFPSGTVSVLACDRTVARVLTTDPRVDLVSLTGGHAAAQDVIEATRERYARTHLELGGKSAALILPDADIEQTIKVLVMASAAGTGQVCALLSRILVPRERQEEFVAALADAWRSLRVGDPFDAATTIGPLANQAAFDKTQRFLDRAIAQGGAVVAGGGRPEGYDIGCYFAPTLITSVARDSDLAQNEVFGPIVAIIAYDDIDEGIAIANDSDFGLSGAVFSQDRELAISCARRIRSGAVSVNSFGPDLTAPWGGFKASGWGREGGPEGILAFTESQQISISPSLGRLAEA